MVHGHEPFTVCSSEDFIRVCVVHIFYEDPLRERRRMVLSTDLQATFIFHEWKYIVR
jgi:hypothetical protein